MTKRHQFSTYRSTMVKARYDFTCAYCGATENIQAHDPTEQHADWRVGVALCGKCHAHEHPDIQAELFELSVFQPTWPNISARTLAAEIGCHNRTVIRTAKRLGIPTGKPLSDEDRLRITLSVLKNILQYGTHLTYRLRKERDDKR